MYNAANLGWEVSCIFNTHERPQIVFGLVNDGLE